jgi:hypothetical protein
MKLSNPLHNKICVKVHKVRDQMKINGLGIHYMYIFFLLNMSYMALYWKIFLFKDTDVHFNNEVY